MFNYKEKGMKINLLKTTKKKSFIFLYTLQHAQIEIFYRNSLLCIINSSLSTYHQMQQNKIESKTKEFLKYAKY